MSWHTMVLSEADSNHQGYIRQYYARVDIRMSGADWIWQQIDINGDFVGESSSHPTEDKAKNDALNSLNGDYWE